MSFNIFIRKFKYGFIAVLVLLITAEGFASGENTTLPKPEKEKYISELIKKSRKMNLSDDPYWHTILHYKKTFTGGYTSLVDDPKFFFAEIGKNDPKKELEATIRSFFTPLDKTKMHPTIKFASRYAWLKEHLSIDPAELPNDGEIWFNKFYDEINPSTITLVFPTGYMSNPASIYGHTLLLINSKGGTRLLSRSVNYAAATNNDFILSFAYKGFFGLYKGFYSFLPYYQKITEYNNREMRDMWEYEIKLTPVEKKRMIRHIVELEGVYSDYFFIDENCSFNLLYLIEAAKPETKITDAFGLGVEPVDTIRVMQGKKLISKRIYRPSLYSKIQYLRSKLNSKEQKTVLDYCKGKSKIFDIDSLHADEEKKAVMCDLASDYLRFMAAEHEITGNEYRSRFISVLSKRNSLPKFFSMKNIPEPIAPENSHLSRKIAIETGSSLEGLYSQFSYRQSCHELMDPDDGLITNSQIIFGKIAGRYYYEDKKFVFQRFDIVNIIAIPPSDSYFFNYCYDFKVGLVQNVRDDENESLSFQFKAASGCSTLLTEKIQIYFLAGINTFINPEYQYYSDLLGGGESGIITTMGPWKNHMYASVYGAPVGEKHLRYSAGLSERIKITDRVSILADYSWNHDYSFDWHEVSAKVNFYF